MGTGQNLQHKTMKFFSCSLVTQPFHILTITLLSLLLPLSFLLLARLSFYNYLLDITSGSNQASSTFIFNLFMSANPAILYLLVSFASIAALIHGLTGKITLLADSPGSTYKPGLYTSWVLLCTLQTCVGLGIEGSISAGIDGSSFALERSLFSRVIFFLGLHETMLHWSRAVVKPVVDDTVFGVAREEKWTHRLSMAMSFGSLWWWRLRDEVEALVIVAEAKKELLMDVGVADLLGWWLYYLTVTIGMVRVVKGLMWLAIVMLCRIRRVRTRDNSDTDPSELEDNKV